MRALPSPAWTAAACLAIVAQHAAAEQRDVNPPRPSHYAPVTAYPSPAAPYSNAVRPAFAEERVEPNPVPRAPLRLAPHTPASHQPLTKPVSPSVGSAVSTVVGSLGVVLGVFLAFAWATRRFAPAGALPLPKEAVELLGHAPLGGRQQLRLLRVGNKLLLVAASPAGLETLTEISNAAEVEHLLTLCRRNQPDSSQAAFQQVLGQLASEPADSRPAVTTRSSLRGVR